MKFIIHVLSEHGMTLEYDSIEEMKGKIPEDMINHITEMYHNGIPVTHTGNFVYQIQSP